MHCDSLYAAVPLPLLAGESLQGYVMLLAGHFQGFCRDLHNECVDACLTEMRTVPAGAAASPVSSRLEIVVREQFGKALRLNGSNADYGTLKEDFGRFDFTLDLQGGPLKPDKPHTDNLRSLNAWRNHAAHQNDIPPPAPIPPLTLANVRTWRASCDFLPTRLDDIMFQQLTSVLGRAPW